MDFDFWFLILVPALFAAGWWARGLEARDRKNNEESVPEAYSRALALLINDDFDCGLQALVNVARMDPDMVELHQVLGIIFRRRGEFENAIKIHRHLAERPDISDEDRRKALSELAQDYLCAGLFDRAEATYRLLESDPSEYLNALRALLGIYVTEHDWVNAIDTAAKLEKQANENHTSEIAHFYCELADGALHAKNIALAKEYLMKAQEKMPDNTRCQIDLGNLALLEGQADQALSIYKQVMQDKPKFAPIVLNRILKVLKETGRLDQLDQELDQALQTLTADTLEVILPYVVERKGVDVALNIAKDFLHKTQSLVALMCVTQLESHREGADPDTVLIDKLLKANAQRFTRYQCKQCGFEASSFNWHCLGCGSWDSFSPTREPPKQRSSY